MRRIIPIALFATLPAMAQAHAGHVDDVAGHNHWLALGLIVAAALVGLWGLSVIFKPSAPKPEPRARTEDPAA